MIHFVSWYVAITLVGWLSLPLARRLFPALADRGYTLSRALGLLLWGYIFFLSANLGVAQNDISGLLLTLAMLAGLSLWAIKSDPESNSLQAIFDWVKAKRRTLLGIEAIFLLVFIFMALMRATGPEAVGTEKPMELAFINAILRSPSFPPNDPWLSGYSISYYYFGYIMTAMLARLTGTPGSIAFNLMSALVYSMGAVGAYGILYNLLHLRTEKKASLLAFLGPLFLIFVSNVEGFLEILHIRGVFWKTQPDGSVTSSFWTWLDMQELSQPPQLPPTAWQPQRYWWWWRASRVIQDYDLNGTWREIIDEFPFFSVVLGDLHPHVLAIPFAMLAVATALNLYLGGWRGRMNLFHEDLPLHTSRTGFIFIALLLGGLSFMNTWDILPGAALIAGAYLLVRVRAAGWSWMRLFEVAVFLVPLLAASILLYLPFYIGFASQAGGLLPNVASPTRGAHLWVMLGTLFVPIMAYLLYLSLEKKASWKHWVLALVISIGFVAILWGSQWPVGQMVMRTDAAFIEQYLVAQGTPTVSEYFAAGARVRLKHLSSLITLLAILVPTLAILSATKKKETAEKTEDHQPDRAAPFVLLLVLLGTLLVLGPEFLYLRDQFGWRINTVFKFYYQAWMVWSVAAAFGAAELLRWNIMVVYGTDETKQVKRPPIFITWAIVLAIVLMVGLCYPILGATERFKFQRFTTAWTEHAGEGFTARYQAALQAWTRDWSLDGAAHLQLYAADEAAAIQWLANAPDGVIAEAVGGSYTGFARMSTYSGQPTVLGWVGHEGQWRGGYTEIGSREPDMRFLYETRDWTLARQIIDRYHIAYIVVGSMEYQAYAVYEPKFQKYLSVVFQQGGVTIYAVP
jgi:YYY domain-containing protein